MQEPGPEDAWRRTLEQVRSATDRMMAGDSGPWKALLSPRDDVVLLGATSRSGRRWTRGLTGPP